MHGIFAERIEAIEARYPRPKRWRGVKLENWQKPIHRQLMANQSKHPWLGFIGLWLAGVLIVAAVSYAIRLLILGFS